MESWGFDGLESPSDSIIRSKNVLMGWEMKNPFNYDDSMLVPNQQSLENHGFPEMSISEMIGKQFAHDTTKNDASVTDIVNSGLVPSLIESNAATGEEDSSLKLLSSAVNSSSRELSLIGLNLGDNLNSGSGRATPSSAECSTPVKRARTARLSSKTVCCQVYGCHKDLSSSKDYHKRHKVCDVHTKTSKVVVNGIEQRFCQQCSRFHLLGEFDDGKRSCRKRLAGHNERRRKLQVSHNSRSGSTFPYPGSENSKHQGTLEAASFICQDRFHIGPCPTEKYGINDWSRQVKKEDEADASQKSVKKLLNGWLQGKSGSSAFIVGKEYPSNENNGQQIILDENVPQCPHEIVSHSLVHMSSFGNEDFTLFDAASIVEGLPGISEPGSALSLLSSQSQNSPGHSSRVPESDTLIIPNNSPHYSVGEASEKRLGICSGLTNGIQRRYPAYGIGSFEGNSETGKLVLNGRDTAISGFVESGLRDSEYVTANNCLIYEGENTVDLLQLPSQLHSFAENQRQSVGGKQESESYGFCSLRMT